jgi:hypothetical protein
MDPKAFDSKPALRIAIIILCVAVTLIGACKNNAEPAEQTKTAPTEAGSETGSEASSSKPYSSFGVRMNTDTPFHVISFKDVGLEQKVQTPTSSMWESIAQSLALELRSSELLESDATLFHDERLADPDKHKHCETDHLYVDLWQSESPTRWGYSLWSGCSKGTRFSKKEVEVDRLYSETSPESVKPLTENIVHSIEDAAKKDCFKRSC